MNVPSLAHRALIVPALAVASLHLLAGSSSAAQVAFRVDMSTQAGYGIFEPSSDVVVVRGTFNGWSGNAEALTDPEEDLVYAAAVDLAAGTHEYKFVVVPDGAPDVWESSIDNRVVEVSGDVVLDVVYFDDDDTVPLPPCDVEVLFAVDMTLEQSWGRFDPEADQVVVRGGHEALGNWSGAAVPLERNGSPAAYSAWARFDGLSNYPVRYKFVILRNGDPENALWEDHISDRVFRITGTEEDSLPAPDGDGYAELALPSVVFDREQGWASEDRLLGADLSFVPRLESLGAEYTVGGVAMDPLGIFADHGYGLVRLRLWHTPSEPWHGLDATVGYASEVVAAGYDLMLDIHYSDTWADPGHQTKPAAWDGLDFATLVDSVYVYTNTVVRRFRDEGALPHYVQIGNEISGGMLWNDGRVGGAWDTPEQWGKLGELISAGVAGARDSLPPGEWPEIIVHVDNGASNGLCRWFFDNLADQDVEFDVIGLSFYPWWHGTLSDLSANLHDLAGRYGREIQVVETSYPWTLDGNDATGNFVDSPDDLHAGYPATPEGQTAFLEELLATVEGVPGRLGGGVIYWEPAYIVVPGGPGNPHENLALFDFDGDALPALGFSIPWGTDLPEEGEGHGQLPILKPAAPNPFRDQTRLAYAVPRGGADVALSIYDITGWMLASIDEGFREEGGHGGAWDGRDLSGREVASSVYLCRLSAGALEARSKVVVLR